MKGVPYKQASNYADGVYGPDDLAAIWNACVNAHKTLAQQPAAEAQPVAWMDPVTEDVIHDMRKTSWSTDYGVGGEKKARTYTTPLYAHPPPSAPVGVEGHTHPHEKSRGCHCVQCRPLERPCGCNGCRSLAQQPAAAVGVEQVASAIAIEDTGVSWHDVSPRDRTHYVKLARAALAAQKGGDA